MKLNSNLRRMQACALALFSLCSPCVAQQNQYRPYFLQNARPAPVQQYCPGGNCPFTQCPNGEYPNGQCDFQYKATVTISPLEESVDLEATQAVAEMEAGDRMDIVVRATCRVTVGNTCGSGTVVGRDASGSALVLTNAHVAGTAKGREVNVERWNTNGQSERGKANIIAAGYGRGMSVDFALLKCQGTFAKDVTPIPLANRYPDTSAMISTYGCPRCEWPSFQVLRLNKAQSQILTWYPEAIGGRSGSSVVDYTAAGPRVVGLLTWGGGGEGLGQSTPFLLEAMKGRLPASLESLPPGVREIGDCCTNYHPRKEFESPIREVAATNYCASFPVMAISTEDQGGAPADQSLIDSITEEEKPDSALRPLFPRKPETEQEPLLPILRERPLLTLFKRIGGYLIVIAVSFVAGFVTSRRMSAS